MSYLFEMCSLDLIFPADERQADIMHWLVLIGPLWL